MKIEIKNFTRQKVSEKLLEGALEDTFGGQKVSGKIKELNSFGLSVAIVGEKRAQELNKTYRKKNYVPNILTFDYGEIVLCPARISQDAKKYGILFEQELVRVFRHGLLHLEGYTHTQIEKLE